MTFSNFHKTFNTDLNFLIKDIAPEAIRFPKEPLKKENIAKEFENVIMVYIQLAYIHINYLFLKIDYPS